MKGSVDHTGWRRWAWFPSWRMQQGMRDFISCPEGAQLKAWELFISEIFYLIFLDHGWLLKPWKAKLPIRGDYCINQNLFAFANLPTALSLPLIWIQAFLWPFSFPLPPFPKRLQSQHRFECTLFASAQEVLFCMFRVKKGCVLWHSSFWGLYLFIATETPQWIEGYLKQPVLKGTMS